MNTTKIDNLRAVLKNVRKRMSEMKRRSDIASWEIDMMTGWFNRDERVDLQRIDQCEQIILRSDREYRRLERLYDDLADKFTCLNIKNASIFY